MSLYEQSGRAIDNQPSSSDYSCKAHQGQFGRVNESVPADYPREFNLYNVQLPLYQAMLLQASMKPDGTAYPMQDESAWTPDTDHSYLDDLNEYNPKFEPANQSYELTGTAPYTDQYNASTPYYSPQLPTENSRSTASYKNAMPSPDFGNYQSFPPRRESNANGHRRNYNYGYCPAPEKHMVSYEHHNDPQPRRDTSSPSAWDKALQEDKNRQRGTSGSERNMEESRAGLESLDHRLRRENRTQRAAVAESRVPADAPHPAERT